MDTGLCGCVVTLSDEQWTHHNGPVNDTDNGEITKVTLHESNR